MGNSASKSTRTLNKVANSTTQNLNNQNQFIVKNLKKQVSKGHLKQSKQQNYERLQQEKIESVSDNNKQIFTQRPPKELEKMGDEGEVDLNDKQYSGNKLFEEAVNAGIVKIEDNKAKQSFNPNHSSVRVLKNRVNVERQYEGLFIPKDADKPNIPDRFLNEEQRRQMKDPNIMKKKLEKTGSNSFGLFDSNNLSDLIIDYKVFGEKEYIESCKENKVNDTNINILKQLIDDGLINLPTHKVTLHETIDPESRQVKQKLIIVEDDWVSSIREDVEREKNNKMDTKTTSKKDLEVFEQFKMLENLVSKSQISTKVSDGPTNQVETVLNRPKKQLGKEIKKML
ncbi:hypothetical protein C6P40_003726 [Pichia californica]|uniref:Uncharacterized protein n=1 Tax=Pichia californica TaxID=460514 RepID=A0A9P6WI95_9ASCO|nr:hypothetical protein C6P40_003726 [[Candida] californica]